MKKQKIRLILLTLLLFAAAAAYAGMRFYNNVHTEEEEGGKGFAVTQADAAAVTGFSFTNENGSYHFEKKEGKWKCLEEENAEIDTVSLEDMIDAAVSVTGEDVISSVEDLSLYGLEEPEITVSFTSDQGSVTLKLGDYNATVSRYYLCLDGENTVYTVDSSLRNAFLKKLDDLKTVEIQEPPEEE